MRCTEVLDPLTAFKESLHVHRLREAVASGKLLGIQDYVATRKDAADGDWRCFVHWRSNASVSLCLTSQEHGTGKVG